MSAKTLRPVEQADLFRLKFIGGTSLSPDGNHAAYTVYQVSTAPDKDGKPEEKPLAAIWLVSLETCESRQLTSGAAVDAGPAWSPDGKQIAFVSTRNEKPQIFLIAIDGGEARQLTRLKQGVGGAPVWSPDGKHIAFSAPTAAEARDQSKPYHVSRHIYRFNELEYLDDTVQAIFVISASGGEPRQVTKGNWLNVNPQWSPDGKELLYMASMDPESHRAFFPRLRVIDLVDETVREITGEWGGVGAARWLPGGQQIVFTGTPNGLPIGSKADVWLISREGGTPECRSAGFKVGFGGGLQPDMPVFPFSPALPISEDGQSAYVIAQVGGTEQICQVALSGPESVVPVITGDRSCFMPEVRGGRMTYIISNLHNPTELCAANPDGSNERCLVNVNSDLLAQLELPVVERMLFKGVDGVEVEGWAVMPASGVRPFPTVLVIHGGPHSGFGHMFHFDTLMLCGAGYAVLLINHRASTGYGDEFSTAIKGDWGNLDYKDLMAGVDYAIERGIADPDKLGVCGLSGGGNLTCWTVGQTTRFKAAVPENPVTNWVSFYGVSDIGPWFAVEQLGGHPHEIPEIYAKCSPITYAHRCKTPTLLVQAEHDWRCPAEQSEQFYTVLKANGCIAEMLRLPGGAHAATITGAPINRRVHNEALLDWMNRYVLAKAQS